MFAIRISGAAQKAWGQNTATGCGKSAFARQIQIEATYRRHTGSEGGQSEVPCSNILDIRRRMKTYSAFHVIFRAGLICGVLDALSAIAVSGYFGASPSR